MPRTKTKTAVQKPRPPHTVGVLVLDTRRVAYPEMVSYSISVTGEVTEWLGIGFHDMNLQTLEFQVNPPPRNVTVVAIEVDQYGRVTKAAADALHDIQMDHVVEFRECRVFHETGDWPVATWMRKGRPDPEPVEMDAEDAEEIVLGADYAEDDDEFERILEEIEGFEGDA